MIPTNMQETFERALIRVVQENAIAIEGLTEKQVVQVLKQAIAAGDIQRLMTISGDQQSVLYLPFAEIEKVRNERLRLKEALQIISSALDGIKPLLD